MWTAIGMLLGLIFALWVIRRFIIWIAGGWVKLDKQANENGWLNRNEKK